MRDAGDLGQRHRPDIPRVQETADVVEAVTAGVIVGGAVAGTRQPAGVRPGQLGQHLEQVKRALGSGPVADAAEFLVDRSGTAGGEGQASGRGGQNPADRGEVGAREQRLPEKVAPELDHDRLGARAQVVRDIGVRQVGAGEHEVTRAVLLDAVADEQITRSGPWAAMSVN